MHILFPEKKGFDLECEESEVGYRVNNNQFNGIPCITMKTQKDPAEAESFWSP